MEIYTEDYRICYDPATATVNFAGNLRLGPPADCEQIAKLLGDEGDLKKPKITQNFHNLEFIKRSGINMLSELIVEKCKKVGVQRTVKGSQSLPWQGKSLKNLQWLMPAKELELS